MTGSEVSCKRDAGRSALTATPGAAQLALRGCCGPTHGCPASRGYRAGRQTAPARCAAPLPARRCLSAASRTSCGPCRHHPSTARCCRVTDCARRWRFWTRWPFHCYRLRKMQHFNAAPELILMLLRYERLNVACSHECKGYVSRPINSSTCPMFRSRAHVGCAT